MDVESISTIPENILKLIVDFSNDLINKVNGIIRMIVLFGSHAREESVEGSDIDLLIVVDDVYNVWNEVTSAFYYDNLNKILSEEKYKKIHVNTLTLSLFWDMVRNGDPLIINILRSGKAIIDPFGLFGSLKKLLEAGRIKPSEEAIEILKKKIEINIRNYKINLLRAFENIYNIFVNTAQYFLMKKGYLPKELSEIPDLLLKEIGEKEIIDSYIEVVEKMKKISHESLQEISIDELKNYYIKALNFKDKLEKILNEKNISRG